jgi:dienelactone hydrolase
MLRIVLGVITGFFSWMILWVGIEKIRIANLPDWYGAPQLAFQHAVENGVPHFTAETRLLLSHIVIGSTGHSFCNFNRPQGSDLGYDYVPDASTQAHSRMVQFLKRHLS